MFLLLVLAGVYFTCKYGREYDQMGPPIAKYEPIVPKEEQLFSYYGLQNPKLKREVQALELASRDDPLMSHFRFSDISKILPYSDPSCPPDGICGEAL